ncbi:dsk1 Protein kinase dsk1 [Candida maltosa Xu316]
MTIESRFQSDLPQQQTHQPLEQPQQPQQPQQHQQLDSPPILRKKSSTASSIFKLSSHKNNKKQQQQPPPTSPNSTSRPNLRSLLRIGSFSSGNQYTHTNNPNLRQTIEKLSTSSNNNNTFIEFDDEDNIIDQNSNQKSDLNFDPRAEESNDDYKTGGYHPVCKGEIYYSRKLPNREYIILRKLGWGHFSTVWLAKSRYNNTLADLEPSINPDTNDYYVALKFVKSNKNYMEAARDEIKIMDILENPLVNNDHVSDDDKSVFQNDPKSHPGYNHVMQLKDDFEISGPNGVHICMVFEILGENVLNLIYKYKRFYRSVTTEIKRKESEDENSLPIQPPPPTKFSKWDSKNWKKSTKSMLSLGLSSNNNSSTSTNKKETTTTTTTNTASSSSTSPVEFTTEHEDQGSATSVDSWEDTLDKKLKSMNCQSLVKLMESSKSFGGIPLVMVKQIAKQLLLALDYMHHAGIIHTDLKPENILIDIKDINKIIKNIEDEKISKFRANSMSRRGSLFRRNSSKQQLNSCSCNHIRTLSSTSNSSQSSFYYRKSKNSIASKYESPIRCSKPLSSSMSSETLFKDVNFESSASSTSSTTPHTSNKKDLHIAEEPEQPQNFDENDCISIKIADLGNATFVDHHFTDNIQTRQYRSPEVILRSKWDESVDIWSIGCILFELITSDYLFSPADGRTYSKDDDHIAQIIELVGPSAVEDMKLLKRNLSMKIKNLNFWGLKEVLVQKYHVEESEAELISSFLMPMLKVNPCERESPENLLKHPWLN